MTFSIQKPSLRLEKYVQFFWEGDFQLAENQLFTHTVTAATCPVLLFYLKGKFVSDTTELKEVSVFYGQTNKYADYVAAESSSIFAVQFHPYALSYLFSMPTIELTNSALDISLLLGEKGKEIEEKIFLAKNIHVRVAIISAFLETKLATINDRDKPIIAAIEAINQSNGSIKPEVLAQQAFLSQRQFERKFKDSSGFSPISYARIVRFEKALNGLLNYPQSLTDVAFQYGYYDQAHFNHDFKMFTGYNPKEYRAVNGSILLG